MTEEVLNGRHGVVTIHLSDVVEGDALWTNRLTLPVIGTISKPGIIHRANHSQDAAMFLRLALREAIEVSYLGPGKKHGGSILTGCDTSTTTDALGRIGCGACIAACKNASAMLTG